MQRKISALLKRIETVVLALALIVTNISIAPIEIHAEDNHTVIIDASGGTFSDGSTQKTITVNYGDTINLSDIEQPSSPEGENWTLIWWVVKNNYGGTRYCNTTESITFQGDNLTIYAYWEKTIERNYILTDWVDSVSVDITDTLSFYKSTDNIVGSTNPSLETLENLAQQKSGRYFGVRDNQNNHIGYNCFKEANLTNMLTYEDLRSNIQTIYVDCRVSVTLDAHDMFKQGISGAHSSKTFWTGEFDKTPNFDDYEITVPEGYSFVGWYVNPNELVYWQDLWDGDVNHIDNYIEKVNNELILFDFDEVIDGSKHDSWYKYTYSINLFPQFQKDNTNIQVKFNDSDGTELSVANVETTATLDSFKPSNPTKEGYEFIGWSTDGTEANIVSDATTFSANTTLTAIYNDCSKITITFDWNDALYSKIGWPEYSKLGTTTEQYTEGQTIGYVPGYSRGRIRRIRLNCIGGIDSGEETDTPCDGLAPYHEYQCTFLGWYRTPDLSGEPVDLSTEIATEDTTFYAKFSTPLLTVHYHDEFGNDIGTERVPVGTTITTPDLPPKVTFSGLVYIPTDKYTYSYVEYDGNAYNGVSDTFDFSNPIMDNVDILVDYTRATYVNFSCNGTCIERDQALGWNEKATSKVCPPNQILTNLGYTEFVGWYAYNSIQGKEIPYDFNLTMEEAKLAGFLSNIDEGVYELQLYAIWRRPSVVYTVTLDANGGTFSSNSQETKIQGVTVDGSGYISSDVAEWEVPVRNGYIFNGWQKYRGDDRFTHGGPNQQYTDGLIFYATWYCTHTVTFKDYDGTVLKTEQVNDGAMATAPANPTREGYKFTGWSCSFTNVTSDLEVTAQYTQNTPTNPKPSKPEPSKPESTPVETTPTEPTQPKDEEEIIPIIENEPESKDEPTDSEDDDIIEDDIIPEIIVNEITPEDEPEPIYNGNEDTDRDTRATAFGRFVEAAKSIAVKIVISLGAILGLLGLLLLILLWMKRIKVLNNKATDEYSDENFEVIYRTSVKTEGSLISELQRQEKRVWTITIPDEIFNERVTDDFRIELKKLFCKRYNGEKLIIKLGDSEDAKQIAKEIDKADNIIVFKFTE